MDGNGEVFYTQDEMICSIDQKLLEIKIVIMPWLHVELIKEPKALFIYGFMTFVMEYIKTGVVKHRRNSFGISTLSNICTPTAGRSSEVERSLIMRWIVGSILHGVDPLSYFSFQPVLHDWCNKRAWYVLSCLWDGAYKRTLAVNP